MRRNRNEKTKESTTTYACHLTVLTWIACSNEEPQEESDAEGSATVETEDTAENADSTETTYPYTFTDTAGNEVTLEKRARKKSFPFLLLLQRLFFL